MQKKFKKLIVDVITTSSMKAIEKDDLGETTKMLCRWKGFDKSHTKM